MNIVFVARDFYPVNRPSGGTSYLHALTKQLSKKHTVGVLCIRSAPSEPDYIEVDGVHVYNFYQTNLLSFRQQVKTSNPDLLVFFSTNSSGSILWLWFMLLAIVSPVKVKIFYQVTNIYPTIKSWIIRLLHLVFTKIISGNADIAGMLSQQGTHRAVIEPGTTVQANSKEMFERRYTSKTITFFGHITYLKGPDVLVALAKKFPQYSFTLVAGKSKNPKDVAYFSRLQSQISKLKNISYTGFVENPMELLDKASIMLLPYRDSATVLAISQSAIEAVVRGIPVLGPSTPALDSIHNLTNGKFVSETEEDFARTISFLLENHEQYVLTATQLADVASETYNIKRSADQLIKILREYHG